MDLTNAEVLATLHEMVRASADAAARIACCACDKKLVPSSLLAAYSAASLERARGSLLSA